MHSNDTSINIQEGDIIKNKKRGDILYYSISQVATLLDQDDSSIRYYTNVFDNILKIEISDKELRYTNKDIDKLEFLINLKDKGMTIKEVQKYCEALPLNIEDLVEVKENNSISVKEVITTIVELENKQIDNLKEYLSNRINERTDLSVQEIVKTIGDEQNNQIDNLKEYLSNRIDESIDLSVQKIVKAIGDEQQNQLNLFRDDILSEIKDHINYKLDMEYKSNNDLYNELSTKIDTLTAEKLSLEGVVKSQLDQFNQISSSRDSTLIDEIRRFKNIIERAYYVQQEVDIQKKNVSFLGKLFRIK